MQFENIIKQSISISIEVKNKILEDTTLLDVIAKTAMKLQML